jgi:hypothetical protein
VVLVLNGVSGSGAGTVSSWTSASGFHSLSTTAYAYVVGLSSDSQFITYTNNYDASAATADVYVAKNDGTGATLLATTVPGLNANSMCYPEVAFAGEAVVLSYCTSTGQVPTGNIESFARPSWAMTTLESSVYPYFQPDKAGVNLLINTTSGLQVIPTAGGSATTIDPSGQGGTFTSDGADVVYVSSSGALMRSSVKAPAPTMLVAGGLEGLYGLSPDDSTALVYKGYDNTTYLTDLYAASATKSGELTTLSAAQTATVGGGQLAYGSPFTGDSSHVLYYSTFSTMSYPYMGTLKTSAVSGGAATMLGQNTNTVFASGMTKAVFEDNFARVTGSQVAAVDIRSVDTSGAGPAVLVVSQANAGQYYGSFFLSPDQTKIVYAENGTKTGQAGVFITAVP